MTGKTQPTEIGLIVKKKLLERNMTQADLSRQLGINPKFLSDMLRGKKKGVLHWNRIYQALGIKQKTAGRG